LESETRQESKEDLDIVMELKDEITRLGLDEQALPLLKTVYQSRLVVSEVGVQQGPFGWRET
jgi:hypothetical protein